MSDGLFTWEERAFGDYRSGRWCWVLERVRQLREPVPCRGRQGLWTLEPEIEAEVLRQLEVAA